MLNIPKRIVNKVLKRAEITEGGPMPWDIRVMDDEFYPEVISQGSLGLGESYMAKKWDCPDLYQFFVHILGVKLPWFARINLVNIRNWLISSLTNPVPKSAAFEIGEKHYDLGQVFDVMLDMETKTYSCAYWKNIPKDAEHLGEAQIAKYELVCQKLGLRKGQRILEVGCGWGGFAHYAATRYGVSVVGLTVSEEQVIYATEKCKGLSVEIRYQDYRDIGTYEKFDHIVSIGAFEHFGCKNYREFMEVMKRCLKEEGLFLLHTILSPGEELFPSMDAFIGKHIFPRGQIPTLPLITNAASGLFDFKDKHRMGEFYVYTLLSWLKRFVEGWNKLGAEYKKSLGEHFFRKWVYYLQSCAAAFKVGQVDLLQVVFSHPGKHDDYKKVR